MRNNGKNDCKLNVLIVGAGDYVIGSSKDNFGTILPAVNELHREGKVANIAVSATRSKSVDSLKRKTRLLASGTGTDLKVEGYPIKGGSKKAYLKAAREIKPDCAIVAVPDDLHYGIGKDLINLGIHTLIVKPFTTMLKEAKELVKLADKKKVYGMIEFHKRFDLANMKLKDFVSEKKLGDLLYVTVEYSQRKNIPLKTFSRWVNRTNIFQYLGVHYADVIYFSTGAKPVRVMAVGEKYYLRSKGVDAYDSIQAMIEWKMNDKKFISTINVSWVDPEKTTSVSDQRILVVGTKGRYLSDQKNRGVQIVTDIEGVEDLNPYFCKCYQMPGSKYKQYTGYGIDSVKCFCGDVLQIKKGIKKYNSFKGYRATFSESLVSTAIVEAVNTSLKKRSMWININM